MFEAWTLSGDLMVTGCWRYPRPGLCDVGSVGMFAYILFILLTAYEHIFLYVGYTVTKLYEN